MDKTYLNNVLDVVPFEILLMDILPFLNSCDKLILRFVCKEFHYILNNKKDFAVVLIEAGGALDVAAAAGRNRTGVCGADPEDRVALELVPGVDVGLQPRR